MKRKVMVRAHEIAKKMVGDYVARLSLALKMAWSEIKKGVEKIMEGFKKISLGKVEYKGKEGMWDVELFSGEVAIEKETEKAVYVVFRGEGKEIELDENDEMTDEVNDEWEHDEGHWLPKSQIKQEENEIFVPEWMVSKKRIEFAK